MLRVPDTRNITRRITDTATVSSRAMPVAAALCTTILQTHAVWVAIDNEATVKMT